MDSDKALSYVPVILGQLDADGCQMLGELLQAMREGGYNDGFKLGQQPLRSLQSQDEEE